MKIWLVGAIVTFVDLGAAAYFFLTGSTTLGLVMLLGAGAGLMLIFQLWKRGQ